MLLDVNSIKDRPATYKGTMEDKVAWLNKVATHIVIQCGYLQIRMTLQRSLQPSRGIPMDIAIGQQVRYMHCLLNTTCLKRKFKVTITYIMSLTNGNIMLNHRW